MPTAPPAPPHSGPRGRPHLGGHCPTAETTADRLHERSGALLGEARRWFAFTATHGLPALYAGTKALDAVALSLRLGSPDLLVPTKLVGVRGHQQVIARLLDAGARLDPGGRITLSLARDGRGRVTAHWGDELLGLVQRKHAWLGPLVDYGVRAVVLQVTGDPARGQTHGVNVALAGIGEALRRLRG